MQGTVPPTSKSVGGGVRVPPTFYAYVTGRSRGVKILFRTSSPRRPVGGLARRHYRQSSRHGIRLNRAICFQRLQSTNVWRSKPTEKTRQTPWSIVSLHPLSTSLLQRCLACKTTRRWRSTLKFNCCCFCCCCCYVSSDREQRFLNATNHHNTKRGAISVVTSVKYLPIFKILPAAFANLCIIHNIFPSN